MEQDLREALEWWVLTSVFEHTPLPAFDGVSLEIVEEGKDGTRVLYPAANSSDASFLDHLNDAEPVSKHGPCAYNQVTRSRPRSHLMARKRRGQAM